MNLFDRYTSVIFGISGAILAIGLYETHEYISIYYSYYHRNILSLFIVMLTTVGVLIGRLVHKLYAGTYTDSLTGLWNRRYLYRRLPEEIERMKRYRSSFCLAFIDVDNFKHINDTSGHAIGDEALSEIAIILKQCTRNIDVITRLGGDEFAIICPETDINGGLAIAERVRNGIANSTQCHRATISVGVSVVNNPNTDLTLILKDVDNLLFKAKEVKNIVVSSELN